MLTSTNVLSTNDVMEGEGGEVKGEQKCWGKGGQPKNDPKLEGEFGRICQAKSDIIYGHSPMNGPLMPRYRAHCKRYW